MSSILKALKKVEQESASSREEIFEHPSIHSRNVLARKMRNKFSFIRYVMAAAVIGLVMAGGWWMLMMRPAEKNRAVPVAETAGPSISPSDTSAQRSGGEPGKTSTPPVSSLPNAPSDTISGKTAPGYPSPTDNRPSFENAEDRMPFSIARGKTSQPQRASQIRNKTAENDKAAPSSAQRSSSRVSAKPETRPAPPIKAEKLQKADPEWLQLQAVSWAEDANRRMAVINNRIVHEGEMVDKGLIVRIDKDSVVVRKDGQKWRVHFDLK